MSSDAVNRLIWGPKLWRLYHLAAEVSDRTDVLLLWKGVFRWSVDILPCELCRKHLNSYLIANASFTIRTFPKKGTEVRAYVRSFLLALHNDVNTRLEKPMFTDENLTELYGVGEREEKIKEIRIIFQELKDLWQPLVGTQINGGAFSEWKKVCALLFALVSGGSN